MSVLDLAVVTLSVIFALSDGVIVKLSPIVLQSNKVRFVFNRR